MPTRRLALVALALFAGSCGDNGTTVLVTLGADDKVDQFDLYVRDDASRVVIEHTGWTPITHDGFKVGIRFAKPGSYSLVFIGVQGATDGDKPAMGAKQFFFATQLNVTGNVDVGATLLHVPDGDDQDRDLFPDAIQWPTDVPAANTIPPSLLDCDDKMDYPKKGITAAQINPFAKDICGSGIDITCDGMGGKACPDRDNDGDPDATDCAPDDPKIHHPQTDMTSPHYDPFPESRNCCGYSLGKTGADASMAFNMDPTCHLNTCDDGIDQDCDGKDSTCFADQDCDGFRAEKPQPNMCNAPPDKNQDQSYVPPDCAGPCKVGLDCNDCNSTINPGEKEICGNGIDDNCNGLTDEGCVGCDLDGDGYERMDPKNGCPDGMNNGKPIDCNDEDAGVFTASTGPMYPVHLPYLQGALALCNNTEGGTVCGALRGLCRNKNTDGSTPQDADCDMKAWEGCPPANCDADGDGYIDSAKAQMCDPGGAKAPYDCDDTDPHTFPNAPSVCGEMKAHNCNGIQQCGTDADGDGYDSLHDCNDNDKTIHPFATELCNGVDDDCDGLTDEGNPDDTGKPMVEMGHVTFCTDSAVGECGKAPFGHCVCSASPVDKLYFNQGSRKACPAENAMVDGATNPSAAPRCYGAVQPAPQSCNPQMPKDDDCDGRVDAPDGKNMDGTPFALFGQSCWPGALGQCAPTAKSQITACDMSQNNGKGNCWAQAGLITNGWLVCNDPNNPPVCPVAEKCNGFDDDCNGSLPVNEKDVDGDGYMACGSPYQMYGSGQICEKVLANGILGCGDCADSVGTMPGLNNAPVNNMAINPAAMDVCDGIDNDCNPTTADGLVGCAADATHVCCAHNGCKDPSNDKINCNGCGNVCVEPNGAPQCVNARCSIQSCNAPFADCNNNDSYDPSKMAPPDGCETNLNTDLGNCGGCARACSNANVAVLQCSIGLCTSTCVAGFTNCNKPVAPGADDGCETHTQVDTNNCGGCGRACNNAFVNMLQCTNNLCNSTCQAGYSNCSTPAAPNPDDGCETHSDVDTNNCGGCGRVCSATQVAAKMCLSGVCNSTCIAGYSNCTMPAFNTPDDGCETHSAVDTNNCGGCGRACNNAFVSVLQCTNGLCNSTCTAGYMNCNTPAAPNPDDGCETHTAVDTGNCGGCGRACNGTQVNVLQCTNGLCNSTCNAGYSNCTTPVAPNPDNGCETHTAVDTANCGGCGRACNGTQVAVLQCSNNLCTSTCNAGFSNCTQPVAPNPDDGCETHTAVDTNNCGACGRACNGTQVAVLQCSNNLCTSTCNGGYANCTQPVAPNPDDGCETHTAVDANNCGACNFVCSSVNATPSCSGGACSWSCNAGFKHCMVGNTGCETAITTATNCGNCGVSCLANNAGHACVNMMCGCNMVGDCNGQISDNCNSPTCQCGGGASCNVATQQCVAGSCLLLDGQTCTMGNQCAGGNCLQAQSGMVCSHLGSCGTCKVINSGGTLCVNATNGTDPKSDCTSNVNGNTCESGACGCANTGNCNGTIANACTASVCKCGGAAPCNIATQQCIAGSCLLDNGQTCTMGTQCVGGHCLKTQTGALVCTAVASCPTCQVIAGDGSACVTATDGTDPKGDCSANSNGHTCESGACGCASSLDCGGALPVCNVGNHSCVQCVLDGDCASNNNGHKCTGNVCTCAVNADCPGGIAPFCVTGTPNKCGCGTAGTVCMAGTQLCTTADNTGTCLLAPGGACTLNTQCASTDGCQGMMTCKPMASMQPCSAGGDCKSNTCLATELCM